MKKVKPTVYILPVRYANDDPSSSAFVRLLLPYVNNQALAKNWEMTVSEDGKLPSPSEADIVIIERDAAGIDIEEISDWLRKLRAAGKKCVLELDDDLFDVDEFNKRTRSGSWTVTQVVASIKWLASAVDAVITSTPHLCQLASEYNDNVFLLPNYLDPELWDIGNLEIPLRLGDTRDVVKIGYVGTATHNADLAIISDAMQRIKTEYGKRVEIEVIGAFQRCLDNPLFGRAVALPKETMYPKFVEWLKYRVDWDIAVIPLDDDHFNQSKSHLKFLECSALGLASICSNVPTYSSIVDNNKNGLLVGNNTEDWYKAIKLLIDSPSRRNELSKAAYLDLVENYTTNTNSKRYEKTLLSIRSLPLRHDVPNVPVVPNKHRNRFVKYIIKRSDRHNRLISKLLNNPHHYFADSNHGYLRPLRYLFRKG